MCFLKLMQMEIDNTSDAVICNYLKLQMLEDLKTFYNQLYYDYSVKRYYELLGELCKYKDAYILLGSYLRKEVVNA